MTTYRVGMTEECGGDETISIQATSEQDARRKAIAAVTVWVRDGEYGDDGASVSAHWTLMTDDGEEIDDGGVMVEVEPKHSSLIYAACGPDYDSRHERLCGDDPDDHDWTSEGEGGCSENPGVWATGGTSMSFASHCRTCGLHRSEHHTGSQRNPGEHDTVEYTMPDNWCAECESEECTCAAD